jgi:hypothetical protein
MLRRVLPTAFAVCVILGTALALQAQTPATTTTTVRPPELVKLEAEAAAEIPIPPVPPGRAAEAKKVAETSVAVKRATWVVEKLLPPPPEGVAVLKLAEIKVGSRGWVDLTSDVVKVSDGVAVLRAPGVAEGVTIGVPVAADAATVKTLAVRGEFIVDRPVTIDGREVLVLKEVVAAKALDSEKAKVLDAARKRLEEAKAAHAQAVAVLKDTRQRAEKAVLEKTQAEAEKQIPVPKDADVEEQAKAKAKQQELALKLAKAELEKIAQMYADTPVVEPTGK